MKSWMIAASAVAAALLFARRSDAAQADDENVMADTSGVTDAMRDLALAIAHAEGFFVAGSIPKRAHNPGDLVIPGWTGATLGDQRISVFVNDADGWNRLYRQLALITSGRSHVYTLDMTFADFGAKWTQTESSDWTRNVIEYLQSKGYNWITDDTTLGEVIP